MVPMSVAHGLGAAADAFVSVSLAGSLFFNISPDASREQVLLYLLVTMIPLAVLAPLDRARRSTGSGTRSVRRRRVLLLPGAVLPRARLRPCSNSPSTRSRSPSSSSARRRAS